MKSRSRTGKIAIGADLGGTKVNTLAVSDKGRIMGRDKRDTEAQGGKEHVMDRIAQSVLAAMEDAGVGKRSVVGVGIGSAGALDRAKGLIYYAPNLPGWRNVKLRDGVSRRTGLPCLLENDANAAAYAEVWLGAGKGLEDLVMITLGTGVGGGVVIGKKVLHGAHDTAAEVGHHVVDAEGALCGCGQKGCLEAYTSGTGIVKRTKAALKAKGLSRLGPLAPTELTTRGIADQARKGNGLAKHIFRETSYYLGLGLSNVVNILNPEMIVLSGGVSNNGDLLLPGARKIVKERALAIKAGAIPVVVSRLGEDAGGLGAAGLVFQDGEV